MKNYILAIATLVGTIIGVGIFTIPYVIVKSGIIALFVFMIFLGWVQYYLHLIFAEIVLSIKGQHRLPGYAEKYYGRTGKIATLVINLISDFGVIIAYIIVGGLFLHQLLNPLFGGSVIFYTTVLFIIQILIVLFGLRAVANSEFVMTAILILLIGFISWQGWRFVDFHNYTLFSWRGFLLPYGPVFFAVSGMVAIPEICQLLEQDKRRIKSVIAWSGFLSVTLMLIFIFVIVGITGNTTTPDTLIGLNSYWGDGIMKIVLLFGLLVVATSFILALEATREIFWYDFKMNKYWAWALASIIPFIFYLLGVNNITKVVSLTGSIAGGILGLVVILLILKVKRKCELKSPIKCKIDKISAVSLSILFLLGFIYEIWNVFFNSL